MGHPANAELAAVAAEGLATAVRMKWFGIAPLRVEHWLPTIEEAYLAYIDGDKNRVIALPEDATTPDGRNSDPAIKILDAFDDYLGRNIVWESLDWALDKDGE